ADRRPDHLHLRGGRGRRGRLGPPPGRAGRGGRVRRGRAGGRHGRPGGDRRAAARARGRGLRPRLHHGRDRPDAGRPHPGGHARRGGARRARDRGGHARGVHPPDAGGNAVARDLRRRRADADRELPGLPEGHRRAVPRRGARAPARRGPARPRGWAARRRPL
ncbi:MAG: Molybdopterin adenylyltransferase, partial [uncultured Solirubrobacteraceae bacterium]